MQTDSSNQSLAGDGVLSRHHSGQHHAGQHRVWLWRGVLTIFVGAVLLLAWRARNTPFEQVDWAFENSGAIFVWIRGLVWREFAVLGLALALGWLTPLACRPLATPHRPRRLVIGLGCIGFGLITIGVCLAVARQTPPAIDAMVLPLASYCVGIQLGWATRRGTVPLLWSLALVTILALIGIAAVTTFVGMAISDVPLRLETEAMGTAEKRALAQRIRDTRRGEGESRELQLEDAEINGLIEAVLSRGGARGQATLHFQHNRFVAATSMALPGRSDRFVNAQLDASLAIDNGAFQFDVLHLKVGRLTLPAPARHLLSAFIHSMLLDDPQIRRVIVAVDTLRPQPGAIRVVLQPGAIHRQVVPALVHLLWNRPDVAHETQLHLKHLVDVHDRMPRDADRFGTLIEAAFRMARERSTNRDPRIENRAAISALAILLGHPDLEPFVGEVFDDELRARAKKVLGTVTLRGRRDLPRHFWVSALLVLLSNEATSDRVGLMKEKLDSQRGGSGFSFVDMLANMAGNRFAIIATQDAAKAAALQSELATGFDVDAFFPPWDGLPEDIPADELQTRFGGPGGHGFRDVVGEIQRRLDALPNDW